MSPSEPEFPQDASSPLGPMSRRSLVLKGAGLAALGLVPGLISACGGGGNPTSGGTAATTTTAADNKVGGTVNYLGFQGVNFPEVLKSFYKENGINVKSQYISSSSQIPAKFAGGGGGEFDLVNFTTPEAPFVLSSGVELQPLDLEQIPNWKYVERFIELTGKDKYSNEDGDIIAAPILWGSLGINYDSAQIAEPTSWEQLLEPEFKNKLTLLDTPGPNYALAAKLLGFSASEMTKSQFGEATEYLKRVLANCRTVASTYGDIASLLASGEVVAAFAGWSAVGAFAAEAGSKTIKTNIDLAEGTVAFVEGYYLGPDAENTASVYSIMNEVLLPKINAEASTSIFCSATAEGGAKLQPKEIAQYYPTEAELDKFFSKSEIVVNPPAVSDKFVTYPEMTEEWTQIKTNL